MAASWRPGYALCRVSMGKTLVTAGLQALTIGRPCAWSRWPHGTGLTIMGVPVAHGTPDIYSWVSYVVRRM